MGAHDTPRRSPLGDVYREGITIPHNPANLLYVVQEKQWEPVEYKSVEATGTARDALVDASTQFHYIYLSELVTLGDIIHNARWADKKRAAVFLAASRMRDVDAWGRYLGLLGATGTVSDDVQRFVDRVYEDDNRLSRLIALVYIDVLRQAIGKHTENLPDPTFQALLDRDIKEGNRNVKILEQTLQNIHNELGLAEQHEVVTRLDRYLAMVENIIHRHRDTFTAFDADPDSVTAYITDTVNRFEQTIQEGGPP